MKRQLSTLFATLSIVFGLVTVIGMAPASAATTVCSAGDYSTHYGFYSGFHQYGSPEYGNDIYSADWSCDSAALHDSIFITAGTSANYTDYASTWSYPTPGIAANRLKIKAIKIQYSSDGSTIAGTCPGINANVPSYSNPAGQYDASTTNGGYDLLNCSHPYVRIYTEHWWYNGFQWETVAHASGLYVNRACNNGLTCT